MNTYRIGDLLDLASVQKLAAASCLATGMPIGIIDAIDGSILAGAGWQDICTSFHRVHPISHERCRESDNFIKSRLVAGGSCQYKCRNGLWDIGVPIVVGEYHLATLFIGQFFYEGETPERELFIRQAKEFGYDLEEYLAVLDRVPVFTREKVGNILAYDITLAGFIADMAMNALSKIETEKTLRESEERFRVLAETSMAGIALYQGEQFVYANPATARIFGCTVAELLEMKFWDWAHGDSREMVRKRELARLQCQAEPAQYECRVAAKSDEQKWVLVSVGCLEFRGKPAGIATFIDITETKRAEEQLRASLSEKEILLKEIHHRVKNNLQVICTLLELQSDYIVDDPSRKFFMESQDRIRSMALVHEKLYQTKDFSRIDFAGYINSLTSHLYRSYVASPEQVTLSAEVGDVALGIDEAIPCGLIINELISNALKYAFTDGRKGIVSVRFRMDDQGMITLTVTDNGVGFPVGLNFRETDSLGLQLVNMLTKQLQGDINLDTDQGTIFTIRFKG
jgi:PAS domain S-box-containing protein